MSLSLAPEKTQNGVQPATESIVTTQADIEIAKQRFRIARNSLMTLVLMLRLIDKDKSWAHLGYRSFKEACKEELTLSRYDGYRCRHIYEAAEYIDQGKLRRAPGAQFDENADFDSFKADLSSKLRFWFDLVEKIGLNKAADLSQAIIEKKIDGSALIEGEKVLTPAGEMVTIADVESFSREEIRALWQEPDNDKQQEKEQEIIPEDPVHLFRQLIKKKRADLKDMVAGYLSHPVSPALFDACKEDVDQLYDDLRQAANDVLNIEKYERTDKKKLPPLPENQFVEVKTVADLCAVDARTVRKWIYEGILQQPFLRARKRKKDGKRIHLIHPDGLQEKYRNLYYSNLARRAKQENSAEQEQQHRERMLILNSMSEKLRDKTLNIELCIHRIGYLSSRKELKDALDIYNREHPKYPDITLPSFYRYRKNYDEKGFRGIADMRGMHRKGETKVSDIDYKYFKSQYMTENQKSAVQCWEMTLGRAKEQGRIVPLESKFYEVNPETGETIGTFPVSATFERLLFEREGEAAITLSRVGEHRFKQTIHFPHVSTQSELMQAGELYVMDHHTFDVFCRPTERRVLTQKLTDLLYRKDKLSQKELVKAANSVRAILSGGVSKKKYVRLWLTNCMDYRTNKQLSWWLHEDPPNSDHVKVVFKWACEKYGIPDGLLTDNGKDFLAYDVIGRKSKAIYRNEIYDEVKLQGVLKPLGVKLIRAIPRQGQAKPIERQYAPIIDGKARQYHTYTGKDPKHLPESTKENLKKGNIPDAMDVILDFNNFVENILNKKAQKKSLKLQGKSPDQLWNELRKQREIKVISKEAAQLMTVRASKERQLHGNGFKMDLLGGHYFWGDWMKGLSSTKQKYYAHWDPASWTWAYIYRAGDNEPMGWAEIELKSPSWARTDEQHEKVAEANSKKKERMKALRTNVRSIQKVAAGMSLQHLGSYVELENEIYEATKPDSEPGAQPMRLVQTKLDEIARGRDNSYENELKERESLDLSLITPESPVEPKLKDPYDYDFSHYVDDPEPEPEPTTNGDNNDK